MFADTNIEMAPSNTTIKGLFRFGKFRTNLIEFNDRTNMVDINHQICQSFKEILPSKFHVEFYSFQAKKLFVLDEFLLGSENNPFVSNSTNSSEETTDIMDYIQLLVVDDSPPTHQIDLQSNTLLDMISSDEFDADALLNTILPDGFDDDTLFNTMLAGELNDALLPPLVVPIPSNEVISHNNISTNDEDADGDTMEDNSETGISLDSQVNSQNSTTSLNEYKLATETTDENITQFTRISFSHDVQPEQKHHYLSNKYNTDNGSNENGGISYIQGVKTEEEKEKRLQVLPHLLISPSYRTIKNFSLLLYAVFEELKNETRIWYRNPYKGFLLHDQLNPDAELFNPIILNLNNTHWKEDGDYTLEIYMLTKKRVEKSTNKEELYRLDKDLAKQIHKAEHVECSKRKHLKPTRLLAVPKIGNKIYWPTCGLSNFIQPPIKTPRSKAINSSTTVQIALPASNINLNIVDLPVVFQPSTKNSQSISLDVITAVQTTSPVAKRKKF